MGKEYEPKQCHCSAYILNTMYLPLYSDTVLTPCMALLVSERVKEKGEKGKSNPKFVGVPNAEKAF